MLNMHTDNIIIQYIYTKGLIKQKKALLFVIPQVGNE